jgi:hypothetical protein
MTLRFTRDMLLAIGISLLIVGIIDSSISAAIVAIASATSAYAIHRRFHAFWWIAAALVAITLCRSLEGFWRGPRTPLAMICAMLKTSTITLLASWWWRQRSKFRPRSPIR